MTKSRWSTVPIGSLVQGIYDGPHATPRKTETGPIFLGISNLSSGRLDLTSVEHLSEDDYPQWTRRVTPAHGDIVFSYETRLGEAALMPDGLRCCLGRRMGLLRVDPALADARFILFAWLAPEFQQEIRRRTNPGSTVDRILLTELADFPIVCPPLDKQIAISRLLGALDDKIDLNHKINALVNELGYALFIEMTSRSNTPPRVDAVTTTVGELARVVGGSTPSTMNPTYWKDGTVAWATPKDLSLCSVPVLLDTERRITDLGAAQIGSRVLPAGTVLLSSRAPVGYLAIAEIPIAINQGFIAMVPKPPISSHFLLRWAQSSMDDIMARANGTTFQEISKRNFRPMTVSVPPRDRLEQFDAVIEPLHRLMVANLRQNRILAELRDLLLPKLVSGQIRIKDA